MTIPGETFHCAKSFAVIREEGTDKGLFDKELGPPPSEIKNSTAPPSSPGEPIEAGVLNAFNQAEEIALVRNQGLEVDYDMETDPDNVSLVETNSADTLFEVQAWG